MTVRGGDKGVDCRRYKLFTFG